MKSSFLISSPNGSVGFASRTGWMTQTVFFDVIKHIAHHKIPIKELILIIMDNHESHISLETIIYCRENGIVLLTFPPHTSHRLQPLGVAVFAPFKALCKAAFNQWISSNPGKPITIYNIVHLSSAPFDETFCTKNISGFKKTGIEPFDRSVFTRDDFCPSSVTDHIPQPGLSRPSSANDVVINDGLGATEGIMLHNATSRPATSVTVVLPSDVIGLTEWKHLKIKAYPCQIQWKIVRQRFPQRS